MVNFLMIIISTIGGTAVIGLLGYLIWTATRPKKEFWKARVYVLTSGARKNKQGVYSIMDLKPYTEDVLEKIHKKAGVIHRLKKLNLVTPAVESDLVENWKGSKEVHVLYSKSGCTLLRKGYDKASEKDGRGNLVFDPMPHERVNLIQSQMAIRKDRLTSEKDILNAIAPYITIALVIMGLVAVTYIVVNGLTTIADKNEVATSKLADAIRTFGLESGLVNQGLGGNTIVSVNQSVVGDT